MTPVSSFARSLLLLLACATVLASCDSALEEDPTSFVGPDNFYNNAEDALAALDGAYKGLNNDFDGETYIPDETHLQLVETPGPTLMPIPNYTSGSPEYAMDNWTWSPSLPNLVPAYEDAYEGINLANAVIDNVPGIENMDTGLRERIVAEARFIRSIHYFNLVRLFGAVPLRRSEVKDLANAQSTLPRTPEDSLYTFLINDLERTISVLPPKSEYSGGDVVRASKGAAQMQLAKVYLRRGSMSAANGLTGQRQFAQDGDYRKALDLINEVIDSGEYTLSEDVQEQYRDMFIDATANQPPGEGAIFAIQRDAATDGSSNFLPCLTAPAGSDKFADASWSNFTSELPFYNSFENADLRKEVSFITEYGEGESRAVYDQDDIEGDGYTIDTPTPYKHAVQDGSSTYCGENNDFVLLRYADLLLMKAEAINEMNQGPNGEAYDAINRIRNRAGLDDLDSDLDYEGFREALFTERSRELFFEHKGWFDVQRYFDIATERIEAHAQVDGNESYLLGPADPQIDDPQDRLFPIPQIALDRNSELVQNDEYYGY
jgi:hypothetical protein